MTISVAVADDQALVRVGFCGIIAATPGFRVVGEAANGAEAVAVARSARPDVVLMDVRMPVLDGIEATGQITAAPESAGARVIILTTFDLDEYVFAALRAGASGFLLKDTLPEDLVTAIRVVAAGDALLAPSITRRLISEFARNPAPMATAPAASPRAAHVADLLTERECEVLRLVATGMSNAEIAARLSISPATAKTHVAHLLTKLDARDRVQLVIIAYQAGLAAPALTAPHRTRPAARPVRFLSIAVDIRFAACHLLVMASAPPGWRRPLVRGEGTMITRLKNWPGWKSSVFWSCFRAMLFLAAALGFGLYGWGQRPAPEPALNPQEPTVTVWSSQRGFAATVAMTLSEDRDKGRPYSLTVTITPKDLVLRETVLRVWFGSVPPPVPGGDLSMLSLRGTEEYYKDAMLMPGSAQSGQRSFNFSSQQQIGEKTDGLRLRVVFPELDGETPGPQFTGPACSPQASIPGPTAAICDSLPGAARGNWFVPVLQAGQSTLTSGDSGLADYQYLAGDAPTLLGGTGWAWTGIDRPSLLAANVPAQDAQQNNLFYSGIYLGVAAGAAIAFLTELLRPVWREDPPEHGTAPVAR